MMNRAVVSVSLLIIGKSSSQMCSHKAKLCICIIHPDCHGSLVTRHSRHASFLDRTFDILDISKYR